MGRQTDRQNEHVDNKLTEGESDKQMDKETVALSCLEVETNACFIKVTWSP